METKDFPAPFNHLLHLHLVCWRFPILFPSQLFLSLSLSLASSLPPTQSFVSW
jgi:hypothetical protein